MMEIRHAQKQDLADIIRVYRAAKAYMDATGNATQWQEGYPSEEMVEQDISNRKLYVLADEERVSAVFYFSVEDDPTYRRIYDGVWRSDAPYGVIHRVASDGSAKGVMHSCVAFCRERIGNLRIDTHENNLTMQRALEREGFLRCGVIYLENGESRIAYQFC